MYTDFADRPLNHLSILPWNGVCETRTHSSHFCANTSLAVKRLHQFAQNTETPCLRVERRYPMKIGMPDFESGAVPIEPARHK